MSRPGRRPVALLAATPVLALALAACGKAIEQRELEQQVARAIESQFGVEAEIRCPGDLDAEVDATTECTATDPGTDEELRLRITVTSVEGGNAEFGIAIVE